ncbi:MAG: class I SAM-dependent DNA methyltransferase [Oscillospiraceae bacterium]|nr:class I SAM-dependent DNA methyltransferase [Oscillospiraceae bacterium]
MTDKQQKQAAKAFAEYWKGKGYEKGQSQPFWLELLRNVYGVENPAHYISFEDQVHIDHTSFIDGYIETTKVLIEQKSLGKDLNKPIKQSDGSLLNPFQQAKRYISELPLSKHPRYVITSNFESFYIYDMEKPYGEPEIIKLENLPEEAYRMNFLVKTDSEILKKELDVSIQAGELVGKIYDALYKQYIDKDSEETYKSLNMLCVRLVFCLYAEDSGLFGSHTMFHDYIKGFAVKDVRKAVIDLFKILDTKEEDRDPYDAPELLAFPYVNGGLFTDEKIIIPQFTQEIVDLLLHNASEDFNWSMISPTIFGAVFESTLNPETRRSGGMHYTSLENIHKVIDPLFLDDLKAEFAEIREIKTDKTRKQKLEAFQKKLASLTFLDPAAGSGNFLTETYLSLRRIENDVIGMLNDGQVMMGDEKINPIKVSINQFYGIEINDFACTVAKTALWIAEDQMMDETKKVIHMELDFLPLKSYANIVEANALRIDWEDVVPKNKLNYIMGNPPFVGARLMSKEQKSDMENVFGKVKNIGNLDYVSAWYKLAANMMKDTSIKTALVSTNSITQGEQVPILWNELFKDNIHINFAYRTFRWDSEASLKAQVHCVIIGFSNALSDVKILYFADRKQIVDNINPYLVSGPNVLIDSRKKAICSVPAVVFGNMPNDNGYLSQYTAEDKANVISKYPEAEIMFKRFVGATEFLHNKERWCLWLKGVSPALINKVVPVKEAVANVKAMRENSSREATRKLAATPTLFGEIRQPNSEYIIIPAHSSENRRYIPLGFMTPDIISSNANLLMESATLFHFGIMMSNVHNSWIRTVCGRIKSDYRYSVNVVYNNFPWPDVTPEQKAKIEQTAQAILDARAKYPDSSLADLYDELTMPPELRTAHQNNDKAVMEAYGFRITENGKRRWLTESETVAELMKMYQELIEK